MTLSLVITFPMLFGLVSNIDSIIASCIVKVFLVYLFNEQVAFNIGKGKTTSECKIIDNCMKSILALWQCNQKEYCFHKIIKLDFMHTKLVENSVKFIKMTMTWTSLPSS